MNWNGTLIGLVAVTTLWLCFAILLAYTMGKGLELNEWGDFAAGVFAPLAFLWFIFGYLRHGDEIALQRQELQHQVDETARLADHSRTQADATEMMAIFARSAQIQADLKDAMSVSPEFFIESLSTEANELVIEFGNSGQGAYEVQGSCDAFYGLMDLSLDTSGSGTFWARMRLEFVPSIDDIEYPFPLSLQCRDALNFIHTYEFNIMDSSGRNKAEPQQIYKPLPVSGKEVDGVISHEVQLLELTYDISSSISRLRRHRKHPT